MTILPEFNNGHESIRFNVMLQFSNGIDGHIFEGVSHAETKESAIVDVIKNYLSTDRTSDLPLCGVSVYQCVLTL